MVFCSCAEKRGLEAWFTEHRIYDVLMSRPIGKVIHAVSTADCLALCLEKYTKYNIHNLLVAEADTGSFLGWLRISDVFKVICTFSEGSYVEFDLDKTLGECIQREPSIIKKSQMIPSDTTLLDLLSLWHRQVDWVPPLLVTNVPSGTGNVKEIIGVVTPADFLHYIYVYGYHLEELIGEPAAKLSWSDQYMLLSYRDPADVCLEHLVHRPLQSDVIGILDHRGLLCLNLTFNSFLPLRRDLDLPIRDFAELSHSHSHSGSFETVTCSSGLTFGQVLHKVLMNRAHFVWRLDVGGKPMGIVHLGHLIAFVKYASGLSF